MNGWTKHGLSTAIGIAIGVGGLFLTQLATHDAKVTSNASQEMRINELMAFKARVDTNIEEWRRDQGRYETRMTDLENRLARLEGLILKRNAAKRGPDFEADPPGLNPGAGHR